MLHCLSLILNSLHTVELILKTENEEQNSSSNTISYTGFKCRLSVFLYKAILFLQILVLVRKCITTF